MGLGRLDRRARKSFLAWLCPPADRTTEEPRESEGARGPRPEVHLSDSEAKSTLMVTVLLVLGSSSWRIPLLVERTVYPALH